MAWDVRSVLDRTFAMLLLTDSVSCATSLLDREISFMAERCSLTASEMEAAIALKLSISVAIWFMAKVAVAGAPCTAADDLALGLRVGLAGERLHLRGHDREALARLTRASGLDRRIEGEEFRPVRDRVDESDDFPDARAEV